MTDPDGRCCAGLLTLLQRAEPGFFVRWRILKCNLISGKVVNSDQQFPSLAAIMMVETSIFSLFHMH
jgi:hypothetical protein